MGHQFWRLSKGGAGSLGLSCSEDGLFLGSTPLIERTGSGYAVRPREDIERLLSRAYGAPVSADDLTPGLATVAAALRKGDLSLARIAAVQLRLPDLPDAIARLAIETEDVILDLEKRHGRFIRGTWDAGQHPRAGTPPNPGWFAPTEGASEWVSLPPGDRIDELGDLVETIANARPEDEAALRAEIKRYYYDAGDTNGGDALNRALSDVLEPGVDRQTRQQILDSIERYSRTDPHEIGDVVQAVATGALLLPAVIEPFVHPSRIPKTVEAPVAEAAPPPSVWSLGWSARGFAVDKVFGANLAHNFRVIDNFADGVVASNKSIDLDAVSYQNERVLQRRLERYVDQVADFDGAKLDKVEITPSMITGRELRLAIPPARPSNLQQWIIEGVREYAQERGVTFIVRHVP